LFTAPELVDDSVGIDDPDEGFGIGMVLVEESVDGGLQIDDAPEDTALEPPLGQDGEEARDGIEPRRRRRREVEVKAQLPRRPGAHLRVLVCGLVVDDQVQLPSVRSFAVDPVEKPHELLMPVPCHALPDHLAFEHVERPEWRGGVLVVRHRPAASLLHRQTGLSAVERPDLALLVDREHQRVDEKADNVEHLVDELRILRL
jgi:hypothetical protein